MFSTLWPARPATLSLRAAVLTVAVVLGGCKGFWDPLPSTGTGTATGTTPTTTSLTSSSSSVAAGGSVNLTATVAPAAATGTVTFYAGNSSIGTGALTSGTATFSATFAAAGTESLTATYEGNSTYAASTSGAVAITVTPAAAAVPARTAILKAADPKLNLVLDPEVVWTPPATVHLHDLARVVLSGPVVGNIDGGHCVLYSGTVFLADGTKTENGVYELQGGGYLAPEEKAAELGCQ